MARYRSHGQESPAGLLLFRAKNLFKWRTQLTAIFSIFSGNSAIRYQHYPALSSRRRQGTIVAGDTMAKFDLDRTLELAALFETEREQRDDEWRGRFYTAVPDATLMAFDPQVNRGPDQFPYFDLAIPDPGPVTPFCITHILEDCLSGGFGATVWLDSSRSDGPEWVFTYGDLLSFGLFGRFDGSGEPDSGAASQAASADRQVLVAAPSEASLPARTRKVIGSYIRHYYQHPDPKIALVIDPGRSSAQNLMVNLTLEQYDGDQEKLSAAVRYLTWFLPRSYSIMAMPDGWADGAFVPLA
jgi:hypothetical protein